MIEHPYWWDTVDTGRRGGTVPPRADVVVVGAGYTGLAAARHLARSGATVIVVDRQPTGQGASSRNGGQVLPGLAVDALTLVETMGEATARQLFDLSVEAIAELERVIAAEAIDCSFVRNGHVQAASKRSHFEEFRVLQALLKRVFRYDVELVSRASQRTEVGTDAYHGVLIDPRSAALNPAQLAEGLALAAERAGARIIEGCAVLHILRNGKRWTVETARGNVDAGQVLVATNGQTGAATPWLQARIVPVGSYAISTEPLDEDLAYDVLPKQRTAFDSKHFLHYFRLTSTRRLVFGGRARFTTPSATAVREASVVLRRDLLALFPELEPVRVTHAWGGTVGFTRDRLPHAGRHHGVFYCLGYGGHGVAMAVHLGTVLARRMGGDAAPHPLLDRRFRSFPLYGGNPWFLPLVGAYFRIQDLLD